MSVTTALSLLTRSTTTDERRALAVDADDHGIALAHAARRAAVDQDAHGIGLDRPLDHVGADAA